MTKPEEFLNLIYASGEARQWRFCGFPLVDLNREELLGALVVALAQHKPGVEWFQKDSPGRTPTPHDSLDFGTDVERRNRECLARLHGYESYQEQMRDQ